MSTKIENEFNQTQDIDPDKCASVLEPLIQEFNRVPLTNKEIVLIVSNLMYSLGAYIEGYKDKGPSLETLEKQYYSKPTAGVGLMLQSLLMSTWLDSMSGEKK